MSFIFNMLGSIATRLGPIKGKRLDAFGLQRLKEEVLSLICLYSQIRNRLQSTRALAIVGFAVRISAMTRAGRQGRSRARIHVLLPDLKQLMRLTYHSNTSLLQRIGETLLGLLARNVVSNPILNGRVGNSTSYANLRFDCNRFGTGRASGSHSGSKVWQTSRLDRKERGTRGDLHQHRNHSQQDYAGSGTASFWL